MVNKEQLDKMTKQELCDYCRSHSIKGYSGKTKAERVKLILNHYKYAGKTLSKTETMDRLVEIQEKYGNDPKKFQKDKEFIKLTQLLGRTRRKPIHLQTIKEVKKPRIPKQAAFEMRKKILELLFIIYFITQKIYQIHLKFQ